MARPSTPAERFGQHLVLKREPDHADAYALLRNASVRVQPLMRARGWHVPILQEMFPRAANLLGLNYNRGAKILLRLRHPHDKRQFLPLDDVVGTLLHELTHIVHGPHAAPFYALLDELRREYDALLVKPRWEADGFVGAGQRLGGGPGRTMGPWHDGPALPLTPAARRAAALAAAHRRLAVRRIMGPVGGQALGTSVATTTTTLPPRVAAVQGALQRRQQQDDAVCCGSQSAALDEAALGIIDLTTDEALERHGHAVMPPPVAPGSPPRRKRPAPITASTALVLPVPARRLPSAAADAGVVDLTVASPPRTRPPPPTAPSIVVSLLDSDDETPHDAARSIPLLSSTSPTNSSSPSSSNHRSGEPVSKRSRSDTV